MLGAVLGGIGLLVVVLAFIGELYSLQALLYQRPSPQSGRGVLAVDITLAAIAAAWIFGRIFRLTPRRPAC